MRLQALNRVAREFASEPGSGRGLIEIEFYSAPLDDFLHQIEKHGFIRHEGDRRGWPPTVWFNIEPPKYFGRLK